MSKSGSLNGTGNKAAIKPGNRPAKGPSKDILEDMLLAFTRKDLPKVMSFFTDDAIFFDPHYPQPRMVGKAAIQQGMAWAMSTLEKPSFKLRHIWLDENSGVAEMDAYHIIKGGMEAKFEQVSVFEVRGGKFIRLQSYVPYPPHGMAGMVGNFTKMMWRVQGKLK